MIRSSSGYTQVADSLRPILISGREGKLWKAETVMSIKLTTAAMMRSLQRWRAYLSSARTARLSNREKRVCDTLSALLVKLAKIGNRCIPQLAQLIKFR